MAIKSVEITMSKTLSQVEEILKLDPDNIEEIKMVIENAVDKLSAKLSGETRGIPDTGLLLVNATTFSILPKSKFRKILLNSIGKKGPYKVVKTYKSWVGISEGLYLVEGYDNPIPVSWCKKIETEDSDKKSNLKLLSVLLAIGSIVQSISLLLLLL